MGRVISPQFSGRSGTMTPTSAWCEGRVAEGALRSETPFRVTLGYRTRINKSL